MFFALWPDRALQKSLASAALSVVGASGGRAVPSENLHITLAFLGSVPEAHIGKVEAIAAEVANEVPREPVQITLDVIEYWKKPKLLCVTARELSTERTPAAASGARLADALKSRLTAAGFAPDPKPFRPHVTLARNVMSRISTGDFQPVTWTFTKFVLVESRTEASGSEYTVLKSLRIL